MWPLGQFVCCILAAQVPFSFKINACLVYVTEWLDSEMYMNVVKLCLRKICNGYHHWSKILFVVPESALENHGQIFIFTAPFKHAQNTEFVWFRWSSLTAKEPKKCCCTQWVSVGKTHDCRLTKDYHLIKYDCNYYKLS